jgi:hypothetical protein
MKILNKLGYIIKRDNKLNIIINHSLYEKIKEKKTSDEIELSDHPLFGKKILLKHEFKFGIIKSVIKKWDCGWYISLVVEFQGFQRIINWQNISSIHPQIVESIDISCRKYSLSL